jgi:serine/threonine protein kinase
MKRPKNSPIYASPEEILVGEYDEKIDVWAAGVAVLALVGGLGDVDAASYKALHKGGVRGALALREHARSEPLVALLEDLLAHEAKDRASAAEALRRHADWLANGPGEEFDEASSSHDREKRGSMSIHPTKGHCRRRSDFGAQARSLLARSDLQREVNRKIRQAPKKERDALAAAISADSLQRHAKHGGPCAHDQCCPGDEPVTPATAFRRCVQKVIVANRRRSADKLLDVLCRDDIMTCSQLEHVLEDLKKVHPEFHHFEDLEKALKDCANRETILHIEISPLVRDHREFLAEQPRAVWKSKFHCAFVDLHAIDATPARWRGDAGFHTGPA